MELILWRHAQAEDHALGLTDHDRQLTHRGIEQAKVMGAWLDKRLPKNAHILASPAARTQQTAHYLGRKFVTEPRVAVGASVQDLLLAARWPDAEGTVLIVGHQPTLGQLASWLLNRGQDELSIKKAAVWWLSSQKRHGEEFVAVKAVMTVNLI